MAKYLVTGGAGFIGSTIVELLLADGHKVKVLDDLSTGKKENIERFLGDIEFILGDVRDKGAVSEAVTGVGHVIHQAAYLSVAGSVENPLEVNDINVAGTLNLLQASRKAGVERFVFASSSSVYGNSTDLPQGEGTALDPISPYAASKIAGEYYCRMFSNVMGLDTVMLRYFNVFGPRQNIASRYSAVIPTFIARVLDGLPCVIDGEGDQTRDFVYVSDVARANIIASTREGVSGKVFNVGSGERYSILDIAKKIGNLVGKDTEPVHGPRRAGDADHTMASIELLKDVLGAPPLKGFEEGLAETIDWFAKNGF
ncbi:MAG: SDR family oxidoreductase [Candidatus Omnitrophica bacterium]|nr:SDR family oxidoreductase [Candidatus Omnitrophota bacterium]